MNKSNNHYQVSCFVYYMANVWCQAEAIRIFGENLGMHFWKKWVFPEGDHPDRATLRMYYEMTGHYREMLVKAAIDHYENDVINKEWIDYQ